MRSATEAIVQSRFRSLLVSEAATRDAAALAAAAASTPSSGHHAAGVGLHIPPAPGSDSTQALAPSEQQHPRGPCQATSLPQRRPWCPATARSHVAAAAAAASSPLQAGASHPAAGFFRGFAASAAGPTRGVGGSSSSSGQEAVAEVVAAEEAARMVLADPMSRLMASQGMPVGLSLGGSQGSGGDASRQQQQQGASSSGAGAGADELEAEEDLSRPPPAEPAYQMEAFSDMLRATAAAARRGGGGAEDAGGGAAGGSGFVAGVQRLGPSQLEDSWGTTRESPADIARRIVESNLDAEERGARPSLASDAEDPEADSDDDGPELPLALSPSEQKYASLEAMSADIKKLDEVFEVLASVPWLDEDVLAEKELRGVAQVGLLGTLEEVGFNIRHQLLRIWAGERGADLAAGPGLEFRDQAALLAILYHTQQIEDSHGPPPGGYLPKPPQQEEEKQ